MKRKRQAIFAIAALLCVLLIACGTSERAQEEAQEEDLEAVVFTDALGQEVRVLGTDSVVSLYGSFAESWSLAGGLLTGVTQDVLDEGRRVEGGDPVVVGTVQNPNLEQVLALSPDLVLLSANLQEHMDLDSAFTDAGIPHAYFRVDTWREYIDQMKIFCRITGREDLYEAHAGKIETEIETILERVPQTEPSPTVLLIRAFSTGARAKGSDNLAGAILKDLGADNLADREESLLEDLSLEVIVREDPDFIFVVPMGSNEEAAYAYLENGLFQNPAWSGLSAVQNVRVVILPKDLFHYKPNDRWGESYAYLSEILYGL